MNGLCLLEQIVAAAVDDEEMPDVSFGFSGASGEAFVQSKSSAIALAPVDALDEPARIHELLHELLFSRRESRRSLQASGLV